MRDGGFRHVPVVERRRGDRHRLARRFPRPRAGSAGRRDRHLGADALAADERYPAVAPGADARDRRRDLVSAQQLHCHCGECQRSRRRFSSARRRTARASSLDPTGRDAPPAGQARSPARDRRRRRSVLRAWSQCQPQPEPRRDVDEHQAAQGRTSRSAPSMRPGSAVRCARSRRRRPSASAAMRARRRVRMDQRVSPAEDVADAGGDQDRQQRLLAHPAGDLLGLLAHLAGRAVHRRTRRDPAASATAGVTRSFISVSTCSRRPGDLRCRVFRLVGGVSVNVAMADDSSLLRWMQDYAGSRWRNIGRAMARSLARLREQAPGRRARLNVRAPPGMQHVGHRPQQIRHRAAGTAG